MKSIVPHAGEWNWVIGPYAKPVGRVRPGETFVVETADAFCNQVVSADQDITKVLTMPYGNPVTGPIFIEGAEPGDTLALTIHSIEATRDYGVSCIYPETGGLAATAFTRMLNDPLPARLLLHPIEGNSITFSEDLKIPPIPYKPFYGTIGTAPAFEAISTVSSGPHGGNMDVPDICPGNTVYFPVQAEGALLHIGDAHAAQGDGEVCGAGIEIPTRGEFTAELIKTKALANLRVESQDFLMAIGNARPMEDAARLAFYELILWLEDKGFERLTAYQLCSAVAKVRLGNMVDPLYSVVAKFPKRYLPRESR